MKSVADGVICLPNQKTFKLIDDNTSVLDTFRITGGLLVEGVRGVWRLLTRPGLIQIHFDDLCALVRDRHSESAFAFVEAAAPPARAKPWKNSSPIRCWMKAAPSPKPTPFS